MNHIASILGVDLPVFKVRHDMSKPVCNASPVATIPFMLLQKEWLRGNRRKHLDDDTASTASASDSDSSLSVPSVSFAEPLVTAVMTRPYTSLRDKNELYYSSHDFVDFRREASGYEPREKLVKFSGSIVSEVWTIPAVKDVSSMYYSKQDLQGFLDEFIASLDHSSCF